MSQVTHDLLDAVLEQDKSFLGDPDADDTELLAELLRRVMYEAQARGLNADQECAALLDALRWWLGPIAEHFALLSDIAETLHEHWPGRETTP
jgi:hypothetical protein